MKAFVILNGDLPKSKYYQTPLEEADLVLCADGGANRAIENSIQPDYVIGDLDSIKPKNRSRLTDIQLIHRPSQYTTDLEKTLQFAVDKKVNEATIIGISGGRFDHQICNLNIVEKFSNRLQIQIIDDSGIGQFIHNEYEFEGKIGQPISLFAFRKTVGITTQGLKYPLQNSSMEWAINDGLSNEIVSKPVRISIKEGCLFVFKVGMIRSQGF